MFKKLFRRTQSPPPPKITFNCATSHGPELIAIVGEKMIESAKHGIQARGEYIYDDRVLLSYDNEMGNSEIGLLTGQQAKTWVSRPHYDRAGEHRLRLIRHCMQEAP